MSEIWDLSNTDASNNDASFGFPENMNPSDVNDNLRRILGALSRWYTATNGTLVSAGSGSAYTIADPNQSLTTSYSDGLVFMFQAHTVCANAPTLAVDGKTAKTIMKQAGVTCSASDIIQDQIVAVAYESGLDKWQMLTPVSGSGAGSQADVITTRGDVIRGSSSGAAERLALGTSGYALLSDGTDADWGQVDTAGIADNAVSLAKMAGGTDGNLITYDANGDPAYVATGTAAQVLTSNGAGAAPTFQDAAGGGSHALYTDQVSSGTGKTALTSGAWRTVALTTEVYDPDTVGSLATNQITLGAGTYRVVASHVGKPSVAGDTKIRFRNVTDGATVAVGFNADLVSAVSYYGSSLEGRFTIAGAKAFELQCYPLAGDHEYAAMSTGEVELWAFVKIVKE